MLEIHRQGDLLFIPIDKIPEDAKTKEDGVIAEGEATGHKHQIRSSREAVLKLAVGIAYLQCLQKTHVDHQEHGTTVLPAGVNFRVQRQREYEPDGFRQVAD